MNYVLSRFIIVSRNIEFMRYYAILLMVFSVLSFSGCSKDDDNPTEQFRYEVTGTVAVPVQIQYTPDILTDTPTDTDLDDYEVRTTLPWSKTVSLHRNVAGAGCSASTSGAVAGQTINIKIYRNDELVAEHEKAVDANGNTSLLLNYYKDGTVGKY